MVYEVSERQEKRRDARLARSKARNEKRQEKQQRAAIQESNATNRQFCTNLNKEVKLARKAYLRGQTLPVVIKAHIPSPLLTEADAMSMAQLKLRTLVGEFSELGISYEHRSSGRWTFVTAQINHFR